MTVRSVREARAAPGENDRPPNGPANALLPQGGTGPVKDGRNVLAGADVHRCATSAPLRKENAALERNGERKGPASVLDVRELAVLHGRVQAPVSNTTSVVNARPHGEAVHR